MENKNYIYSINPDDENVFDISSNGFVEWSIPFASIKGEIGDIIYIYITDQNNIYDNTLSYIQKIAYKAEIIKIESKPNQDRKNTILKINELYFNQASKLSLKKLRKIYPGFHPSQSYPIDLQELKYLKLKKYIEKIVNLKSYTIEDEILNNYRKYSDFFIWKYKKDKSRRWVKLQGDISLRVIRNYIADEIKNNTDYEVSGVNSFIVGFPTEFDLMIVKRNRKKIPDQFSNIYYPNDIKTVIEIKTAGIIGEKTEIDKKILGIKKDFDLIKRKFNNIDYVYLTISERATTKRQSSINYFDNTVGNFDPYKAFCLYDNYKEQIREKEWKNFMKAII